jgi:hypothetical protein
MGLGRNQGAWSRLCLGVLGPVKALQTQRMTFRKGKCNMLSGKGNQIS